MDQKLKPLKSLVSKFHESSICYFSPFYIYILLCITPSKVHFFKSIELFFFSFMANKNELVEHCKRIHDALGSASSLVQLLASLTNNGRLEIREIYMKLYGEDLASCLRNVHGSDQGGVDLVYDALSLWMLEPSERDATVIREALKEGQDTNFKALIEIFVGRKSSHFVLVKQAYWKRFRSNMDQEIVNIESNHSLQRILVALAASHRAHHEEVSHHIAKCDARRLYEAGEGSSGSPVEAVVLEIFSKRSIRQLKLTFSTYKCIYGHDYIKMLWRKNCGEFEESLKLVIKCMCNPSKYYAETFYAGLMGTRKDNMGLAQALISRVDTDMDEIQTFFNKKYKMELQNAVCESGLPPGGFRDFLVALVTKTNSSQDLH